MASLAPNQSDDNPASSSGVGAEPSLRTQARHRIEDATAMIQRLVKANGGTLFASSGNSPWKSLLEDGPMRLTSGFGMRKDPFTGFPEHHNGIDIAAPIGTRVYPLKPGRVAFSGWDGGYGRTVVIQHADGTETRYGHTSKNLVQGRRTECGVSSPIALVGSTGRSTGPHLHFEYRENGRPVDPIPILKNVTERTPRSR